MSTRLANGTQNLWDAKRADGLGDLDALALRSNLLGEDRAVANYGGGNTSTKTRDRDHTGREIDVLWVKGSGSDLATIRPEQFTGLKLDEVLLLEERDSMTDEEMVAYIARCQLRPDMPRGSIETLLHAFVPYPHVDHTHPDAVNMICCSKDGERLAKECFGDEAIWIDYIRPGFTLSKQVGDAVKSNPKARYVLLAKHGLVTWGETHEESYSRTVDAINRAAEFVEGRDGEPFGGARTEPLGVSERESILADVLPVLRGALSRDGAERQEGVTPKILRVDCESEAVLSFVCGRDSRELSQVGAACPDHLVRTKFKPLWIDFDPETDDTETLKTKIISAVADYRADYQSYFSRYDEAGEEMSDANPRVVLIRNLGLVAAASSEKEAALSRDFYHRAIEVMRGAHALGGYTSLTEEESYAVEYWPMEMYKLTLAPPPAKLVGKVALVTGGAGAIGAAICRGLAELGACVVVSDLSGEGAEEVATDLDGPSIGVESDVTSEADVRTMYREGILEYGGIDIVVSNAGLASSAPVEETSVESWEKNHDVLVKGYFLVAREAFRVLGKQDTGGSLVFVASKSGLLAGKDSAAYSSAKAAELHLARCLAEEGGAAGIRVNSVNPDAVIQGSGIWDSDWKAARAATYGISEDGLEAHYRERTTLKVNVAPEDVVEAVVFFASDARSSRTTGNFLNVDGGIRDAYPR